MQERENNNKRHVVELHESSPKYDLYAGSNEPVWKKILVNPSVPTALFGLIALSKNLWWSWNYEAAELFEEMNPELFETVEYNPIALIEAMAIEDWDILLTNKPFVKKLDAVMVKFNNYMEAAKERDEKQVAYFSMEYGLHDTVKIYSGGLGMLAGDYLKEASDSNYNMIGIGLLYRYGYFNQKITANGDQIAEEVPQKFSHLPLQPVRDEFGEWRKITIALPGRNMYAKVWRLDVGRTPLYLLDADVPENQEQDKKVTHQLYGGDIENRLKQELLLGVGGIRLLSLFEKKPEIYHCNEGHAAFIGLERTRNLMGERGLTFQQAKEVVNASTLFTTHTPVPAGHDTFSEELLQTYIPHYAERFNISWNDFMNLGRFVENDVNQPFSMSVLAIKFSQEINGVSKIHGRVSREMFAPMYNGYFPEEVPIGHVTNGVHFPTWTAKTWLKLYEKTFGADFLNHQLDADLWKKIHAIDNSELWSIRKKQKAQLIEKIKKDVFRLMSKNHLSPKNIMPMIENLDENALTIGFARRFATYKRANLLFSNLERLETIVNNPERPVQFVFAGKAHPHDKGGQELIKNIIKISRMPQFLGKIFFMEGYNMEIAKYLIRGVDIWLNTPTRPLEASGTSGEKAVMNGIMNFSVLDGWWAEGYRKGAGWAIEEKRTFEDQQYQNELDAEVIFTALEEEIVPMYYNRKEGVEYADEWMQHIKNTIADIAPRFTMKRQLDDYINHYYTKLFARIQEIKKEDFALAKSLVEWKGQVNACWHNIEVKSVDIPANTGHALSLDDEFVATINLDLKSLSSKDVGIEVLFGHKVNEVVEKVDFKHELVVSAQQDGTVTYSCKVKLAKAGVYDFVFRIFPQNEHLVYRQDLNLVKWL